MEPKDFYFELSKNEDQVFFLITPKKYYDTEGCLSDESGIADDVVPQGFCELAESTYEYDGNPETGRQLLISLGMKEIDFGFKPGDPSQEQTDNEEEYDDENAGEDEPEDENDLDSLLKSDNAAIDQFDYKNISTDKLMRHIKMMLSTDAFEEAAKIRDELNSRGVHEF